MDAFAEFRFTGEFPLKEKTTESVSVRGVDEEQQGTQFPFSAYRIIFPINTNLKLDI